MVGHSTFAGTPVTGSPGVGLADEEVVAFETGGLDVLGRELVAPHAVALMTKSIHRTSRVVSDRRRATVHRPRDRSNPLPRR